MQTTSSCNKHDGARGRIPSGRKNNNVHIIFGMRLDAVTRSTVQGKMLCGVFRARCLVVCKKISRMRAVVRLTELYGELAEFSFFILIYICIERNYLYFNTKNELYVKSKLSGCGTCKFRRKLWLCFVTRNDCRTTPRSQPMTKIPVSKPHGWSRQNIYSGRLYNRDW